MIVAVTGGRNYANLRNRKMLSAGADLLVAFPGGAGTTNAVKIAEELKIPVLRIEEPT